MMLNDNQSFSADDFSYEMFDRQMHTFLGMWRMVIDAWDDYGTQEMTFDIMSLSAKAARLCGLADVDMSLQTTDITNRRMQRNIEYHASLDKLMHGDIAKLMENAVKSVRATGRLEGRKWPKPAATVVTMLSQFDSADTAELFGEKSFGELSKSVALVERTLYKKNKPTKFPGMPAVERLWNLLCLFVRTNYLLYHFHNAKSLHDVQQSDDELGRIFEASLQSYVDSETGRYDVDLYFKTLLFDNGNKPLSAEQLRQARLKLRGDVPHRLQLCFMTNVGNLAAMAKAYLQIAGTTYDDYMALLSATAKWQITEQEIYRIEHPETIVPRLYNEVFHTVVGGRPVDMLRLRQSIAQMTQLITRKNHWFALWCVLRHHNLINDLSYEHFVRQMMHRDWFADIEPRKRFTGDTLREYSGYFTSLDYTAWSREHYLRYRIVNNKVKWSESLCDNLLRVCFSMEEVYGE